MDVFWKCTFWPLTSHPRLLCIILQLLYQITQIMNFLLVMQIAITFISEIVLDCIVHKDSIDHPSDDICILATWSTWRWRWCQQENYDIDRLCNSAWHRVIPSNELHLYPLHSFWLVDPFCHHTNQTLLLQRENSHNIVNELVVESLEFEAEQQNYGKW